MVKAILENGAIRPLEPLPVHWSEGQELLIEELQVAPSPEELAQWARGIEETARKIPQSDHEALAAALDEQRRESKEKVRRQMGLRG